MRLICILLFTIQICLNVGENGESLALSYLHWKMNTYRLESSDSSPIIMGGIYPGTHPPNSNSSNILPNCQAFVTEFSKRASKFIECSVDNARPFRFCERCVKHYQKAKKVYEDIEENDKSLDNCKAILLDSDRVQVINSVHLDIEHIWNSADCGKCFSDIGEDANGTVHFTLTENTQKFLRFYDEFTHCIPRNATYNATVCVNCNQYYDQMNKLFDELLNVQNSPQHVCMDIVDMMNYTRLTWGEQLNCTNVHKEYVAVFVVGACLLTIPLVFYVSLGVYGTKKTRNLMKEKRLSLFEHSHEYGNLDSPSTVVNQSVGQSTILSGSNDITEADIHSNVGKQQSNLQHGASSYQTFT